MKHYFLIACLCLLLGAVVNVLVAWGCAVWAPPTGDNDTMLLRFYGFGMPVEPAQVDLAPGGDQRLRDWLYLSGGQQEGVTVYKRFDTGRTLYLVREDKPLVGRYAARLWAGWPMRSMWCETSPAPSGSAPPEWSGGVAAPPLVRPAGVMPSWMSGPPRPLSSPIPLRPVILGSIANTAVFGGAAFLVIVTVPQIRRGRGTLRCRRGQCPACAYPVGSGDVCSECGLSVRTGGSM